MNQSMKRILFSAMAMIFLLAACQPAQPAPNPEDTANQVATSVALTVAAQDAQTKAAQSSVPEATNTTLPTQTAEIPPSPTLILPTATPFVVVPPTVVSGGSGGGVPSVKPDYACDTIRSRPFDNTILRPNATFDIKWTIVNTGTKIMRAGLDLHFNSGTQMTAVTRVELPQMNPGDQYAVQFDGVAPAKEGTYVMTFIVEGGLCYPYVAIKVEK
jgi:hypothetical protein